MGPDRKTGIKPLNCSECLDQEHPRSLDEVTRRAYHCAFMDREQWIGDEGVYPRVAGYSGECCPGRLMTLSMVHESQVAVGALRQGALREYYPDQQASVLIAAMELHAAYNEYEAEQLKPENN